MCNVCAVIVSYNPEICLYNNVKRLSNLVNYIVIVDNRSTEIDSIENLKKINNDIENCEVIYNNKNEGIANALNKGCKFTVENNYEWVLTLDDDSLVSEDMIINLINAYNEIDDKKIKIVAPTIVDFNVQYTKKRAYKFVNTAITSGSLIRTEAFKEVGWFMDEFFIDMVDVEFCLRLKKFNFKILEVGNAILFHRLGHKKKILKLGKLEWDVYNHNEIRKYYILRNTVQLYKKYFFLFPLTLLYETKGTFKIFFLDTLFAETNKFLKYRLMLKGIIDGISNHMGSLNKKTISR